MQSLYSPLADKADIYFSLFDEVVQELCANSCTLSQGLHKLKQTLIAALKLLQLYHGTVMVSDGNKINNNNKNENKMYKKKIK